MSKSLKLSGILLCGIVSYFLSLEANAVTTKAKLAEKQVLKIGNGSEPRELDPAKSVGHPEGNILSNLFEGLTSRHPVTLKPIPGMAESWKISEDKKTYTFKIRKDAKWSDGKNLTAEDFVFAWRRALAPATASEYAYQLYYIKNGEAYNKGKISDPKKLGVSTADSKTLVVELENPTPFFLQLTAFTTLMPTPKHVISKFKGQEWTKPENMVSNGPFKLDEWRLNQHVKVVKNPHYWDKASVKVEEAYFMPIENIDTEEKSFFAGELHKTNLVPYLKIPSYKNQKAKTKGVHPYRSVPALTTYFYRFNTTKAPLNDPRVRKALSLAIDRKLIVEKVEKGGQAPAGNLTPPGTGGYNFESYIPPSVTKASLKEAKKLLAEAGFPNGKGFPKLEILYNTNENHKKVALAVQQMWKKNLGITIGIINQEWKVYLNSVTKLDYDIARAGWVGDYLDPNTFLDMFVTDGGNNNTGWSNNEYDQLIDKAGSTSDQAKRFEFFTKAENILVDKLPIMPIYFYTYNQLVSDKLRLITDDDELVEYPINMIDIHYLKYAALVE